MPAIEVDNLHRHYGAVEALRGISFTVEPGEVVGLLGPNGAGKSTALRVLTGWLAPTQGTVRVGGVDVLHDPVAVRRQLGVLPEGAPLPDELSVRGALDFAGRTRGLGAAERAHAIGRAASTVGIDEVLTQRVGTLSRGYRQRVGLAQALLGDPPILVLDEPTTGLDPNQIAHVRSVIRDLGASRTVLLSTHVLREVEATCDRVLILDRGTLVADSTPERIAALATGAAVTVALAPGKVVVAPADVHAQLGALDGVTDVQPGSPRDGEALRLELSTERDVRADVSRWAQARGHVLVELTSTTRPLEAVFRRLTADPAEAA